MGARLAAIGTFVTTILAVDSLHAADAPRVAGALAPPARDPVEVELGALLGGAYRFGDSPFFEVAERGGFAFGGGLAILPLRLLAVGLSYEHLHLGREVGTVGPAGSIALDRDLNTLWASLRLYLVRTEIAGLSLDIAPGLVWQSADATGTIISSPFGGRPEPFTCEASDAPALGLRIGFGGELRIAKQLWLVAGVGIDNDGLSSSVLDDCVPGAGTTTTLGLRGGVAYRIDVTRWVR